jgi:hypothetical protein
MLTLFKNFLKTSDTGENKIIEYLMRNPSLIFHLSDDMWQLNADWKYLNYL